MKKIKVSELPIWDDLKGLWVMGTNALNQSVRVSLEFIKEHTEAAIKATETATAKAVLNANVATSNANQAASLAMESKTACDTATAANNTATTNILNATKAAIQEAGVATRAAETAKQNADASTDRANTATSNANAATRDASKAAITANDAAQRAQYAEEDALFATREAEDAASLARESADYVTEQLGRFVPDAIEVSIPASITLGNTAGQPMVSVKLHPENVKENVFYTSDSHILSVDHQGYLYPNAVGNARVNVIPAFNAALGRTYMVNVHEPFLRMVALKTMRFASDNSLRFS